jgi:sterol desaturase/sphingolipid hydroxylase (fatty acid hydroxylase superfamily)
MTESVLSKFVFISAVVSCGVLWVLESVLPFFPNRRSRYKHALVNVSVATLNTLISSAMTAGALVVLSYIRPHWQGLKGLIEGLIEQQLLVSAALVVCFDLWAYLWHRLNHAVPLLWRFHRFHHADAEMDVTTGFRFHPLEIMLSEIFRLPVLALLGMGAFEILLYNLLSFPIILMHHSNVALPIWLDRLLAYLFPSPNVHRLHHSANPAESNMNFGSMFSVWDRLFGSLIWRKNLKALRLGIEVREL